MVLAYAIINTGESDFLPKNYQIYIAVFAVVNLVINVDD